MVVVGGEYCGGIGLGYDGMEGSVGLGKFPRAMFLWQSWFVIEKYAGMNKNIW